MWVGKLWRGDGEFDGLGGVLGDPECASDEEEDGDDCEANVGGWTAWVRLRHGVLLCAFFANVVVCCACLCWRVMATLGFRGC